MMLRYGNLVALAVIGVWLTKWAATASHLSASSDLCELGGLGVTYRDENYRCGKKVALDVFSNGAPPVAVTITSDEDADYYTLVMVDPDAPKPPTEEYWLHWLVVNIKRDDFIQGYHGNADEKMEYKPPSPPMGTGFHRYQFFAFEQLRKFSKNEAVPPDTRGNFDLKGFQSTNMLDGPVAGYEISTRRE